MGNRNKELLKNTMILLIGQFVPKIMALIILPILTGCLTKTEYGLYDLTLTVASFCIPLMSVQIQQAVFRYLIEKEYNRKKIISSSLVFIIFMYTAFSLLIIVAWYIYTRNILLATLFMISYIFEAFLSWGGQVARGLGHNINYSMAYAIYSIAFVVFLGVRYLIENKINLEYVIFVMILSYAVSISYLLFSCHIMKFVSISQVDFQSIKKMLTFSGPMVISSVALWIVNLSDRFCVSAFLGLEINAIYAVANKIPNLVNSFYSVFNLAWTENTSRLTKSEKESGYYTEIFNRFYMLLIGMILCFITITPFLFKILINSQYEEAYGLMSWLYVGVLFNSLASFLGAIYVGEKKTKEVGISSIIGAIINLGINLLFMKRFGVLVTAISTIISYFAILLYRVIDIKKYVPIKYYKSNIVIGITMAIFIAILNYSFRWTTTIISVIITLAFNLIFNRKVIIDMMRKMKRN